MLKKESFFKASKICFVLFILCFAVSLGSITGTAKKAKIKNIIMNVGDTYQLKYGKKYEFFSSKPKVAIVTKKGKIKAKKSGKSIVKVYLKKKIIKRITVNVEKKLSKEKEPADVLKPEESVINTLKPDLVNKPITGMAYAKLKVESIEKTDTEKIYIYCVPAYPEQGAFGEKISENGIQRIRVISYIKSIENYNINIGDTMVYTYSVPIQKTNIDHVLEVVGGMVIGKDTEISKQ